MSRRLTVGMLFERMKDPLELELLGSASGLEREITSPEASSPGLVLAGYLNRFPYQRIQVLGETEITYLQSLGVDARTHLSRAVLRLSDSVRLYLEAARAAGTVVRARRGRRDRHFAVTTQNG